MEATKKLSILVTGTNRGLGKQLALQLIQKNSNANFLFTSRKSPEQFLKQCPQLSNSNKDTKVELKKLDLTCQKSIQNFVQQVKKQHWEFDAIVNNAAMGCDFGTKVPQPDWAKALLYSNVVGTIRLTNFLLPLLKENGRVVNVSSKLGALSLQSQQVIDQFSDPQLEQQQIFTAVQEYIALCEEGDLGKWYKSAYATSKMMLNAWSRFILKKKLKLGQVSIAISPGHCATDMGGKGAMHSAESGAKAIYDCIFMENPSSDVFYHRWTESEYIHCGPKLDSALIEKKQK